MANPETVARTLGYPKCPSCGTVHQVELTPGVALPAICGECGAALEIHAPARPGPGGPGARRRRGGVMAMPKISTWRGLLLGRDFEPIGYRAAIRAFSAEHAAVRLGREAECLGDAMPDDELTAIVHPLGEPEKRAACAVEIADKGAEFLVSAEDLGVAPRAVDALAALSALPAALGGDR